MAAAWTHFERRWRDKCAEPCVGRRDRCSCWQWAVSRANDDARALRDSYPEGNRMRTPNDEPERFARMTTETLRLALKRLEASPYFNAARWEDRKLAADMRAELLRREVAAGRTLAT